MDTGSLWGRGAGVPGYRVRVLRLWRALMSETMDAVLDWVWVLVHGMGLFRWLSGASLEEVCMMMVVAALLGGVKGVDTELGGIMRQFTGLLACSRGSHLGIWSLISSRTFFWQLLVQCLGIAVWSTELVLLGDDFTGSCWVRRCTWRRTHPGAIPGLAVDTCCASVLLAFGRISLHFHVDVDLDLEVILSVLTQNGEVCWVVASGCGLRMRACTWNRTLFLWVSHVWQSAWWMPGRTSSSHDDC